MKRTLSLLLAMLMLAGMLVGCQETPASPADTTELAEKLSASATMLFTDRLTLMSSCEQIDFLFTTLPAASKKMTRERSKSPAVSKP